MRFIERWLGFDDNAPRQERAPLWKRAVWHAVKTLVRKYPSAALGAAGAGAGYMVKGAVTEGAEVVQEKVENTVETLTPDSDDASAARVECRPVRDFSREEKRELIESLTADERRELRDLAKR